jgi:Zn-dependent protease with chaperone function
LLVGTQRTSFAALAQVVQEPSGVVAVKLPAVGLTVSPVLSRDFQSLPDLPSLAPSVSIVLPQSAELSAEHAEASIVLASDEGSILARDAGALSSSVPSAVRQSPPASEKRGFLPETMRKSLVRYLRGIHDEHKQEAEQRIRRTLQIAHVLAVREVGPDAAAEEAKRLSNEDWDGSSNSTEALALPNDAGDSKRGSAGMEMSGEGVQQQGIQGRILAAAASGADERISESVPAISERWRVGDGDLDVQQAKNALRAAQRRSFLFAVATAFVPAIFSGLPAAKMLLALGLAALTAAAQVPAFLIASRFLQFPREGKLLEQGPLDEIIKTLAEKTGFPLPRVMDSPDEEDVNVGVSGSGKNLSMSLTGPVRRLFNVREARAVFGHEFGHIKLRHLLWRGLTIYLVIMFHGSLLIISGLKCYGPLFSMLVTLIPMLAMMRGQEFAADAYAALITKDPRALAVSLRTLQIHDDILDGEKALKESSFPGRALHRIGGFLLDHPYSDERIQAMNRMMKPR